MNPEEIEAALPILRVLIGQHVRALTRTLPGPDDPGVTFWLPAQSLGQIRNAYKYAGDFGEHGERVSGQRDAQRMAFKTSISRRSSS